MAKSWTWNGTGGADGTFSDALNWNPLSIRNATYRWLASGSGTDEYYLDLAGGGNPEIVEPAYVNQNGTAMAAGTAGSLAAGEWDFADNDTLGYSTAYVRLTAGGDPDSTALNYLTFQRVPAAGDSIFFPAGITQAVTGYDHTAVALAAVVVANGNSSVFGSATSPLSLKCTSFSFAGSGRGWFDLVDSATDIIIAKTALESTGQLGLYVVGTAIDEVFVRSGSVGIAALLGQTATVAKVISTGSNALIVIGSGGNVTTIQSLRGEIINNATATTIDVDGGNVTTEGTGAVTTVNVNRGKLTPNSTGTITSLNHNGGTVDALQTTASRVVTTYTPKVGATLLADESLTLTTDVRPTVPFRRTYEAA